MADLDEDVPDYLVGDQAVDMSSLASDEHLVRARAMAKEFAATEEMIEKLEERLKKLRERRQELAMREIPEFFDSIHTDAIGVPEAGVDVKVVPYFHANIQADWPEEQRRKAFDYLEQSGDGDVVRVTLSVDFGRKELKLARELETLIRSWKGANEHPPRLEMGVPWNTLTKLVREKIEAKKKVDLDVLGATVGRTAKIVKRRK